MTPLIASDVHFDVSSLALPVPENLDGFRSWAATQPSYDWLTHTTGRLRLAVAYIVVLGVLLELLLAGIPTVIVILLGNPAAAAGVGVLIALGVAWLYWRVTASIIRRERSYSTEWPRRYRLHRFALQNGLRFTPEADAPSVLPAILDDDGLDSEFFDVFTGSGFVAGAYRTSLRVSKVMAPKGWGFLQVRLHREVPHLLLTPKKIRGFGSGLFIPVDRNQILELEGDFGKHFTLYAPVGYETDALYVITPDLMALLIDQAPGSFVEARNNVLTIAFPGPLDATSEQTWRRYSDLLTTIGRKGVHQTSRYADARSPRQGWVAEHGRLLKGAIPVGTAISVAYLTLHILHWMHVF